MPAVALTDTNGLYAAVQFYKAAQKGGVKAIVGVAVDVEWPQDRREIPRLRAATGLGPSTRNDSFKSVAVALLAADMEGYSNLCQLVTLRHLGTTKLAQNIGSAETDGRPVTLEELAEHSHGVIALCPLPAKLQDASNRRGTIYRAPTKKNQDGDGATEWIARLKEIFGDRLYIEVQHLDVRSEEHTSELQSHSNISYAVFCLKKK